MPEIETAHQNNNAAITRLIANSCFEKYLWKIAPKRAQLVVVSNFIQKNPSYATLIQDEEQYEEYVTSEVHSGNEGGNSTKALAVNFFEVFPSFSA